MNDETQKELMAFMEGELTGLRANRLAARLQSERGLREAWESQYCVSFLLQNDRNRVRLASADFADRVAWAIVSEPSILAPQSARRRGISGSFWIKAGSVAAVLVVSVTLVGVLPHNIASDQSVAGSGSGHYAMTAMLRGFSSRSDEFHLRPVAGFTPQHPGTDILIQRDIQRLWVPGGGNYLGPSQIFAAYDSGRTGLESTGYTPAAGISTDSMAFPAGNP
ncbi:MAG: sigma-E factor negative regulatory protein [Acidithiobacillus ferrivorans]